MRKGLKQSPRVYLYLLHSQSLKLYKLHANGVRFQPFCYQFKNKCHRDTVNHTFLKLKEVSSSQPMLNRESEDLRLVWRLGMPISQAFTLAANRSEQSDSPTDEGSGETLTNIKVFEFPPKQGCI